MAISTVSWPRPCRSASPAKRWTSRMSIRVAVLAAIALLAGCRQEPSTPQFPDADRDVAPIVSDRFSTEDARDRLGEAEQVMELAGVKPGKWIADVGAGEGYYT